MEKEDVAKYLSELIKLLGEYGTVEAENVEIEIGELQLHVPESGSSSSLKRKHNSFEGKSP
jgi:hypothetical protein